jgi:hypothetical protein
MQMQSEAIVMTCLAEDCSYNCREECCAPAIEIGDDHPRCDTYTTGEVAVADTSAIVQDCMVSDCHFNNKMTCGATGVTLATHSGHADCLTFRQ